MASGLNKTLTNRNQKILKKKNAGLF